MKNLLGLFLPPKPVIKQRHFKIVHSFPMCFKNQMCSGMAQASPSNPVQLQRKGEGELKPITFSINEDFFSLLINPTHLFWEF